MKLLQTILIGILLSSAAPASADFKTIALASEVALSDLTSPASENGIVSFRKCPDCEVQTVRVTEQTRYVVDGKSVELADFRKRIALVNDRERATAIVMHHLESDTVTSISVDIP